MTDIFFWVLAAFFLTVVGSALLWLSWAVVNEWLAWERLPICRVLVKGPGPALASQDAAVRAFVSAWKDAGEAQPQALERALPRLHIEWRAGTWVEEPDLLDEYGEPMKTRGRFMGRSHIIVAYRSGEALGDTAFFEEMLHVANAVTGGKAFRTWSEENHALVARLKKEHSAHKGFGALARFSEAYS